MNNISAALNIIKISYTHVKNTIFALRTMSTIYTIEQIRCDRLFFLALNLVSEQSRKY